MEALNLSELTLLIKESINISFSEYYMVIAEINQLNINRSGHAYLQLVEKEEGKKSAIASMRAMIWANKFRLIQAYFESVTGSELSEDIKILAKVEVSFHEVYGMSLIIHDIDPTYTLGDIEKQRQEIINQLTEDGVIDMNKNLDFPLVPQRIAIISSATAAGYTDFLDHIINNEYNYDIKYTLFEAVMQGDKTEKSVISALDKIFEKADKFDLVIIIRGGGSKLDLSAFDSYDIAVNIAQFPLPVLTGIGHQRDTSIADIVAYKNLKTPTAVADFIIQKFIDFDINLSEKFNYLTEIIKEKIDNEHLYLTEIQNRFKIGTSDFLLGNQLKINNLQQSLKYSVLKSFDKKTSNLSNMKKYLKQFSINKINENIIFLSKKENNLHNAIKIQLNNANNQLKIIENKITDNDPQHILNKGFSLTFKDGKIITNVENLSSGDEISTRLKNGEISSIIN